MFMQICDFSGPRRLTWFTTSILAAHSLLMIRGSEGRREGGDSPATARGGRGEGGREGGWGEEPTASRRATAEGRKREGGEEL